MKTRKIPIGVKIIWFSIPCLLSAGTVGLVVRGMNVNAITVGMLAIGYFYVAKNLHKFIS